MDPFFSPLFLLLSALARKMDISQPERFFFATFRTHNANFIALEGGGGRGEKALPSCFSGPAWDDDCDRDCCLNDSLPPLMNILYTTPKFLVAAKPFRKHLPAHDNFVR